MATLGRAVRAVSLSPRKPVLFATVRFSSTEPAPPPAHRRHSTSLGCPHEYANPSAFLGTWKRAPPSGDPAEAQKRLALMRREYAKQVKQLRRQYAYEVDLQLQEKLRKDEARRESVRVANEERKASKAAAAKVGAAERKIFEEEFRKTLLKERKEKVESWRCKEALQERKKSEKNELLRRQSSMWIDESELDKRIVEALIDTTQL